MIAEKMTSLEVLSSHPKVHLLAQHLLIPPRSDGKDGIREKRDITVAGLRLFWSVAKYHVREGVIHDADLSYIDAVVDYPGFGQAMEKVGWVKYDKRRNCLLLPGMKGEQKKADAKKSQAALRQKRYRMRLKVRNWIVEGKKAAAELVNNSRIKNQEVVITHDMAYDEEGGLLKFGSITVDGKTMYVGYDSPQHRATDKHGRPSWASDVSTSDSRVTDSVTACGSCVTQSVTDSATPGFSDVTQGISDSVTYMGSGVTNSVTPGDFGVTRSVTQLVPNGDSDVTQSVTNSVTVGDSRVTQSVTDSATPGDSRVTPSVTDGASDVTPNATNSVTPDDAGVTQSVSGSVTTDDSDVTQGVTHPVTHGDPGVTASVTDGATPGVSDVTQGVTHHVTLVDSGVTQSVTQLVPNGDSDVTQSVTNSVTVGDSGVTPGVTKSVTHVGSGVTPGIAKSVTHGDSGVAPEVAKSVTHVGSGVTPGIPESVTVGASDVTPRVAESVTFGDFGVTQSVTNHAPRRLSRVIPSRAHTRFSFLRSKTLRSKHKTTHSAREKIFKAAMRFKIKTARGQNPTWPERSGHPRQNPVSLSEPRNHPHPFDTLLNVTQSFTLWRNGQSAACVTQKTRHAELTPLPENAVSELGKFRLFSEWSPSADFLANAQHIGLTLSREATDYEVAEFINYWSEEGAQHTQKQWETKLARFIGKGRKRAAKRASGHQDFTIPTSMDYAIPDGFHGG